MVPQKRTVIAAASALAVSLALAGCGLGGDDGNANAQLQQPGAAGNAGGSDGSADTAPEDGAGAGTGKDKAPAGKLTDELVAKKVPRMGNVVTDAKGWVLYRFDQDKASPATSNCDGDCAKVWPPLLVEGGTPELTGIDPELVGTILREDGGRQVTIGDWPVYRYIGDTKPGQWKGQAVGGTWYVVQKNGKKNLTCLPEGTPKAVKPPADDDADASADKGANADADSGYSSGSYGSDGY